MGAFAALIGVLAVISPVLAPAAVLGLVFVVAAFRDLALGVALFTTITFLEALPGVASPALGSVKVAGVVLVFAALRRRGTPLMFRDRPALSYLTVVLVFWAVGSSVWAPSVRSAAFETARLALVAILMFVVFAAVREARHARWLIWGYIAGADISALVGLVTTSRQPGRIAGGIGDPNFLAAILVSGLAFVLFTLPSTSRALARWLLGGSALLFAITFVLTESRGGLIALAAMFVTAVAFGGPVRRRALAFALALTAVTVGYYALLASPQALARVTHAGAGSGRTDIWSVAARVVQDHPLAGVGIGNFPVVEASYAADTVDLPNVRAVVDKRPVVHNTYLEVMTELGIVGFVLFGAVLTGSLVVGVRAVRTFVLVGARELELLARGVIVAIVSLLTAFVFLSGEYEKSLWLLLGLSVALDSVARGVRASSGSTRQRV